LDSSKCCRTGVALLALILCSCATKTPARVLDDGRFTIRFVSEVPRPEPTPEQSIAEIFGRTPIALEQLKGKDAPWIGVFAERLETPWYTAKGPLDVKLRDDSHLNFNYILESYSKKLHFTYEDMSLQAKFMRRYFVPVRDGEMWRLYTVLFYSDTPIRPRWYRRIRNMMNSVRIDIKAGASNEVKSPEEHE
jgi:hypothetical protein